MAPANRQEGMPMACPPNVVSASLVSYVGWAGCHGQDTPVETFTTSWMSLWSRPAHRHNLLPLGISRFPRINSGTVQKWCFYRKGTAGMEEKCLCVWIYDPGDCKPAGPQHCKWKKRTVGHA